MCKLHIMTEERSSTGLFDILFAPLARLLVARGILFPDFAERMKAHYLAAARAKAEAEGKVTDSKLSVLTGLQRRDIVRLREAPVTERRPNHLARLIGLWRTDPRYDAKPLPRMGEAGSFEALAREVRQDVHPRTMLDTLLATGTVEWDEERDEVRLMKTSYQPLAGSTDQLAYLTRNLGDHLSAAVENVTAETSAHFERALHYSDLTEVQIDELDRAYREAQMALFEELSARAAQMKGQGGTRRFRAGGYFYSSEESEN